MSFPQRCHQEEESQAQMVYVQGRREIQRQEKGAAGVSGCGAPSLPPQSLSRVVTCFYLLLS